MTLASLLPIYGPRLMCTVTHFNQTVKPTTFYLRITQKNMQNEHSLLPWRERCALWINNALLVRKDTLVNERRQISKSRNRIQPQEGGRNVWVSVQMQLAQRRQFITLTNGGAAFFQSTERLLLAT